MAPLSQLSCSRFAFENPFPALACSVCHAKIHELSLGFRRKSSSAEGRAGKALYAPHTACRAWPPTCLSPLWRDALGDCRQAGSARSQCTAQPQPWCVAVLVHGLSPQTYHGRDRGTAWDGAAREGDGCLGPRAAAGSGLKYSRTSSFLWFCCATASQEDPSWYQNSLSTSPVQNGW